MPREVRAISFRAPQEESKLTTSIHDNRKTPGLLNDLNIQQM
ncbi:hypothetical protein FM107_06500 [Sphingobacterium sp. JB170]|nr:hypothetical protein FM107_06500 [Sphingobacterium sp. JB170]